MCSTMWHCLQGTLDKTGKVGPLTFHIVSFFFSSFSFLVMTQQQILLDLAPTFRSETTKTQTQFCFRFPETAGRCGPVYRADQSWTIPHFESIKVNWIIRTSLSSWQFEKHSDCHASEGVGASTQSTQSISVCVCSTSMRSFTRGTIVCLTKELSLFLFKDLLWAETAPSGRTWWETCWVSLMDLTSRWLSAEWSSANDFPLGIYTQFANTQRLVIAVVWSVLSLKLKPRLE